MKVLRFPIIFIILILLLTACAPVAAPVPAEVPPTSVPTTTPLPTSTPHPPTETPEPPATFTSTPRPILPTLTSVFIRANGSVYALGDTMYVVFGRFDEMPEKSNNLWLGKFYLEGDPANTPISAMIPSAFSLGKYQGSFAGDSSWSSGTGDELMQLFGPGDLIEMRIPVGFAPDNDKILAELANGNWDILASGSLYLNPMMVGVSIK